MEPHPTIHAPDRPASLQDDVLLKRIIEYRRERQELYRDEQEAARMKLEVILARLEEEALRRGLPYSPHSS